MNLTKFSYKTIIRELTYKNIKSNTHIKKKIKNQILLNKNLKNIDKELAIDGLLYYLKVISNYNNMDKINNEGVENHNQSISCTICPSNLDVNVTTQQEGKKIPLNNISERNSSQVETKSYGNKDKLFNIMEDNNFIGRNLSGQNFSNANLTKYSFINCDLSGINFSGSDLSGIKLTGSNLTKSNLSNTKLLNTNLDNCILNDCNLSNSNLSNAILINSQLKDSNLFESILCNTNLTNSYMSGCDLSNSDLSNAILENVNLKYSNLSGTNVSNSNFSNSILSYAIFKNVRGLGSANLMNTKLDNLDI